jgi:hypothetical protein
VQHNIFNIQSNSESVYELDQRLKVLIPNSYVLFKSRLSSEALIEGWNRSEKFNKTRIRERGLYFLCLISGTRKIDEAKVVSGYNENDHMTSIIFENDEAELIKSIGNLKLVPHENNKVEGKEFYFRMTMVELELIKK